MTKTQYRAALKKLGLTVVGAAGRAELRRGQADPAAPAEGDRAVAAGEDNAGGPAVIVDAMADWERGAQVPPPHDEIIERFGADFLMYRRAWGIHGAGHFPARGVERIVSLHQQREEAIKRFGFSIPSAELLECLRRHQPILEIGAGTGYMTSLMRRSGIDVVGSDARCWSYGFEHGRFDPDQVDAQGKTMVRRCPGRTVFCSWPTLDHTWFRQALRAMRPGQKLIVVREDACAEDSTWNYLDAAFKLVEDINVPAWPHMNDTAELWKKTGSKR